MRISVNSTQETELTLHDMFYAAAITGLLSDKVSGFPLQFAQTASDVADAMLVIRAARATKKSPTKTATEEK